MSLGKQEEMVFNSDEKNKNSLVKIHMETEETDEVTDKSVVAIEDDVLVDDEEYEDEEDDDNELQKLTSNVHENFITEFHPETLANSNDEVKKMTNIVRDKHGIIIDDLHRTLPFMTKYERTRLLGQRAKQLENGALPLVDVPSNICHDYNIAELELEQKKIPFIVKRPLPGGGFEFWKVEDLELI